MNLPIIELIKTYLEENGYNVLQPFSNLIKIYDNNTKMCCTLWMPNKNSYIVKTYHTIYDSNNHKCAFDLHQPDSFEKILEYVKQKTNETTPTN